MLDKKKPSFLKILRKKTGFLILMKKPPNSVESKKENELFQINNKPENLGGQKREENKEKVDPRFYY